MAAIAPWVSLISVSLNMVLIVGGVTVIARRGGWAYFQARFLRRQIGFAPVIDPSPYYLHRQSQFDRLSIAPTDVVFIGDSITDEGEWSDWFPSVAIRNRGISSDTTSGVRQRLPGLLQPAPETIFLMIGVNDLINLRRSPEQVLSRYEDILTLIKRDAPKTQVYVQSLLPVIPAAFPAGINPNIIQLNQGIAALAASLDYVYVDLHQWFVVNGQLDQTCTTDGIHLNGEGYARWVTHLDPLIKAIPS